MREHGVPQFTVDGHRPVGAFDLLGVSFSTELGYTNLLTALDLAGIPLRARGPRRDAPGRRRRRPRRVQPGADRGLRRRRGARRRRGGRRRDQRRRPRLEGGRAGPAAATSCCCGWPRTGGVYVPRFYDVDYLPDGRIQRVVPNRHGVPWRVAKHTVMDLDELAVPEAAAGAGGRERARADERRDLPRLHPRLPVLPGRHDHPAGARAVDPGHRRDGRAGPGRDRLRGGRAARACRSADHSEIARGHQAARRPLRGHQHRPLAAEHAGRRVQHRPRERAVPQRPPVRADVRARGRQRADPQGDQQDGHRGGPGPHGRDRVRQRLAPGEALLHVRAADGDRRGRPADRRAGEARDRDRPRGRPAAATSAAR